MGEAERQRVREGDQSSICWFTHPRWPQWPRLDHTKAKRNFIWITHANGRAPSTWPPATAFPITLLGAWMERGAPQI